LGQGLPGRFKRGAFRISTLTFNLAVLWLMALLLYAALYVSVLTHVLDAGAVLWSRMRRSRLART
jgi:hypothetical protein